MPSAGMGIGFVIDFVLISLALYTCQRQCRRCTRPKSRRRQAVYAPTAPTFPLAPFAPAPSAFQPNDPMQALVLFAQLQQQQQRDIVALTDEVRLLSSRPCFSVVDEHVPASQATSPVVSLPATTSTAAPPAASLSSLASPSRLTAAPVL